MERHNYLYAGLRVASELVLPEWAPFEQALPFVDPDVLISLARAPDDRPANADAGAADTETYHLAFPDAGDYWVRGGRAIMVAPAPQAHMREVRIFLLGSAWGALCYQRGLLFLHASVVRAGEHAFALCGPSGSGKSTLAASLVARGYTLVADDLCRFELAADGMALVHPSAPRLKLWRDALGALEWNEAGLERDHFRLEKFHVPLHPEAGPAANGEAHAAEPVRLRALYVLEWGDLALTRLRGLTALSRLVGAATYRGDMLEPLGQMAAHWQRCEALARRVPVLQFTRPRDWPALPVALDLLLAHWQR